MLLLLAKSFKRIPQCDVGNGLGLSFYVARIPYFVTEQKIHSTVTRHTIHRYITIIFSFVAQY